MRWLIALSILFLSGCGALGGGATYRVDITTPDGHILHAQADTVQSSDTVELDFIGNPLTGEIKGLTFKKTGVKEGQWTNDVINKLIQRIPMTPVVPVP